MRSKWVLNHVCMAVDGFAVMASKVPSWSWTNRTRPALHPAGGDAPSPTARAATIHQRRPKILNAMGGPPYRQPTGRRKQKSGYRPRSHVVHNCKTSRQKGERIHRATCPDGSFATAVGRNSSGQPGVTVQLQLTGGITATGEFGVIATKPISRIGEVGPENTSLTAAATEPVDPSYGCGFAGPAGAPGTVMGPSVS